MAFSLPTSPHTANQNRCRAPANPLCVLTDTRGITRIMTQRATYCASFCAHVPNIVAPRGILTMTQRMPAPLRSHPAAHTSQIPCQENSNYDPARGCSSAPHGILIVTRRMVALLLSRHHPTPQTAHDPKKSKTVAERLRTPSASYRHTQHHKNHDTACNLLCVLLRA